MLRKKTEPGRECAMLDGWRVWSFPQGGQHRFPNKVTFDERPEGGEEGAWLWESDDNK